MRISKPRRSMLVGAMAVGWALLGAHARAAEPAETARPARWDLRADASYASSGQFHGWGGAARGGWLPVPSLMFGASVETTSLDAHGTTNFGVAFSQSFRSTLVAGFVQGRFPLWFVTPYAELALGEVFVSQGERSGSQCTYAGGSGEGLAAGADVYVTRALAAGLRASIRHVAHSLICTFEPGPWTFDSFAVRALAFTVAYRF